ncbi:hypothetical protein LEMLEM_LOCUS25291, partial [Lemmus lemmus]
MKNKATWIPLYVYYRKLLRCRLALFGGSHPSGSCRRHGEMNRLASPCNNGSVFHFCFEVRHILYVKPCRSTPVFSAPT